MSHLIHIFRVLFPLGVWAIFYALSFQFFINWTITHSFEAPLWIIHLYTFSHLVLLAIPAHVNQYILLPRYLMEKNYKAYFLNLLLLLILINIVLVKLDEFTVGAHNLPEDRLPGHYFFYLVYIIPFMVLFSWTELLDNWYKKNKEVETIKRAKLDAELKWLKAQIHPHFLFNALNNIRVLVRFKSENAEDMLVKLSDLMRYVLANHADTPIPLQEEVEHIENYISLACMKAKWNGKIHFYRPEKIPPIRVEPLIFTNFVENALKHGNLDDAEGFVHIHLEVKDKDVLFSVLNSVGKTASESPVSGIGLANVKRRLEILYPDTHQLEIYSTPESYRIDLSLRISPTNIHL
ncbi:MAG: histidine kinase, partial [Bacteroidota bacterium]